MDDQPLIAELLEIERRGWQSLCDGSGDAFYGEVLTDDALMILANGQVMRRDEVVSALAGAPGWTSFDLDDVRLVRTGTNSATLVYIGSAVRDPGTPAFVAAMSSTYVRTGDAWKLALYQQTPVTTG